MLVIRDAQMSAMAMAREQQFRDRLMAALREHNPARLDGLGPNGARVLVERALAVAAARGMKLESSIADLAGLLLDLGPEAHRHPRVVAVLENAALAPDDRVRALFDQFTAQEWSEIALALPPAPPMD